MSKGIWTVVSLIATVCMVAVIGVSVFSGGCSTMIECSSGMVPMKCHWTFAALPLIACIGVVSSVAAWIAKGAEGRRIGALLTLATCVVIALVTSPLGIGLCGNADMACRHSALIVWIVVAVAAVAAIIQLVKANPEAAARPKMKL